MGYNAEKIQHEWNKWLKIKEIIPPEDVHAIAQACDLAAKQFRIDEATAKSDGQERIERAFKDQAERCERIAYYLEL